jgi:hypothetical protein
MAETLATRLKAFLARNIFLSIASAFIVGLLVYGVVLGERPGTGQSVIMRRALTLTQIAAVLEACPEGSTGNRYLVTGAGEAGAVGLGVCRGPTVAACPIPSDTTDARPSPARYSPTAGFVGFHSARHLAKRGNKVVGLDNFNDYYPVSLKRARAKVRPASCARLLSAS